MLEIPDTPHDLRPFIARVRQGKDEVVVRLRYGGAVS